MKCPEIQEMKNNLSGMYWEGKFNFQIPVADSSIDAIRIFKKNAASITWNNMSSLERNPTNLPQTETILKGQSVSGISIDDLMQVKNYGDGIKNLLVMLSAGSFKLNEATASSLHNYVGREEALTWGKFRDSDVSIGNVEYIPPDSKDLKNIAEKGFTFLEEQIGSPQERAIALFLFMCRSQFFHDANKRTASIMLNGHLLQNSLYPITIFNQDSEEFHVKLTDFYNTGNATKMMQFFEHSVQKMYPKQARVHSENVESSQKVLEQAQTNLAEIGLQAASDNEQELDSDLKSSELKPKKRSRMR